MSWRLLSHRGSALLVQMPGETEALMVPVTLPLVLALLPMALYSDVEGSGKPGGVNPVKSVSKGPFLDTVTEKLLLLSLQDGLGMRHVQIPAGF